MSLSTQQSILFGMLGIVCDYKQQFGRFNTKTYTQGFNPKSDRGLIFSGFPYMADWYIVSHNYLMFQLHKVWTDDANPSSDSVLQMEITRFVSVWTSHVNHNFKFF